MLYRYTTDKLTKKAIGAEMVSKQIIDHFDRQTHENLKAPPQDYFRTWLAFHTVNALGAPRIQDIDSVMYSDEPLSFLFR